MKSKQLTFARQYRGYTQTELAKAVDGLSQSNLSKFEKGLGSLSDSVLKRVMEKLGFPIGFLDLDIGNTVVCKHYRKKASIRVSDRDRIDRFVALCAYCFDWMTDAVEIPEFKFKYMDLENGITPEEAALYVRKQFRLGLKPVENICNLLESNGVSLFFWNCPYEEFDGVSLISDKGNHLVVVNKNMSNDRIRYSLAHELGHIIMHQSCDIFVPEIRDKEDEANRFAAELLMPVDGIKHSLDGLMLKEAKMLKQYWLTSMHSILLRAKKLGKINEQRFISQRAQMSRNGWLKKEPVEVFIDEPVVIRKSYELITKGLNYDNGQMAQTMKLPLDIIKDVFDFKQNVIYLKQRV